MINYYVDKITVHYVDISGAYYSDEGVDTHEIISLISNINMALSLESDVNTALSLESDVTMTLDLESEIDI